MVAESGERIVGYMIYELHRESMELLNFAVARDVRRQSVGRRMLAKLASKLSERRRQIRVQIADFNLDGQLFFRACGYRAVAVLHGTYDDSDADAYLMQYRLSENVPTNRISRILA